MNMKSWHAKYMKVDTYHYMDSSNTCRQLDAVLSNEAPLTRVPFLPLKTTHNGRLAFALCNMYFCSFEWKQKGKQPLRRAEYVGGEGGGRKRN